ncbi:C2H2 type zinc finger domain protein [Phlyctema vagabunda]|uniref:C2H2 type zinc finger domain protein n=1 Tax=Phlyctema vagabunda TaxID=108571 RepID=A0ABR4PLQ8_9HELO
MANPYSFSRDGNHSGNLYPPTPLSSRPEQGHYGFSKGMGPPALDMPPQPIEIDLNSRLLPNPSVLPSWEPGLLPSSGLGDMHSPYGSSSMGRPQQYPAESRGRGGGQDPILSWYTGNDGPWIPKGISAVTDERHPNRHQTDRVTVPFGGQYRESISSENGTLQYGVPPSDSGYGTRRSVGTASVFAGDVPEKETDCQSLTGHIGEYSPFQGLEPQESRNGDLWSHSVNPAATIPIVDTNTLYCNTCAQYVKTRSELKKHHLRHTKPFVCNVPECSRKDGFSTVNDLDRHKRSKHPHISPSTRNKAFHCIFPGCKSKDKVWPRLDNFKSHLKRVHSLGEAHLDELVKQAETNDHIAKASDQDTYQPQLDYHDSSWSAVISRDPTATWRPIENHDQGGKNPQSNSPISKQDILHEPICPPRSETVQSQDVYKAGTALDSTQITQVGFMDAVMGGSMSPETKTNEKIQFPKHIVSAGDGSVTGLNHTAFARSSLAQATNIDPAHSDQIRSPESECKVAHEAPNLESQPVVPVKELEECLKIKRHSRTESLDDVQEAVRILRDKGYTIHGPERSIPKINSGSVASNKSEKQVTCSLCQKFRGRPCELKKHMKRHDRPYGCTFLSCNKSFGSKNDWKRHENSQHYQLETWRCQEEKPEGGSCAKVCYRRQGFKDHLSKEHFISNHDIITEKLEGCRIGRNCQSRFWCGFCKKLVGLTMRGLDAWTERFNHIDDHFMGRNGYSEQRISDWTPVDSDRPKGLESITISGPSTSDDDPSPSCGSSEGSLPDVLHSSSQKTLNAQKRKAVDEQAELPRKRPKDNRVERFIACCQCDYPHLAKLHHHCTYCNDGHRFCNNCKTTSIKANLMKQETVAKGQVA